MEQETITIHFGRPLPVFPLPGVVLLPHSALPLHVFEPRYRRMTNDALDSDGLIAMGQFATRITQQEYEYGRPPLRPIVCVGYCEQHERLSDGRYLLLLRGLCRAQILEEITHDPYRQFYLDPIESPLQSEALLAETRHELRQILHDPLLTRVVGEEDLERLFDPIIPTPAVIDVLIGRFCEDAEQRYHMLAEPDARRRARWLVARLHEVRQTLASAERG